jgi:hypothetical protein
MNAVAETILTPPSFIEGLTPADMLAWGRVEDGPAATERMLALYGRDTAIDLLSTRYNRARLLALLDGVENPANEEQAAFLAAVRQGQPVSLLSAGSEDLAEAGFAPTLRQVEGGWEWRAGAYQGQAAELKQAVQFYVTIINQMAG